MRKVRPSVLAVSMLLLLPPASFFIQAQQPEAAQGQTSIREESSEVVVDAVVTDRKNHLVPNLSQQDFVIYEDGVPQGIGSFSIYRGLSERLEKPTQPTATKEKTASAAIRPSAAAPMPNLIILLLDYSTTRFENEQLVRDASLRYVEQKLRPDDLMAVFVLGSGLHFLTNFTGDKSRLMAALKSKDLMGSALSTERASLSSGIDAGQAANLTNIDTSATSGVTTSGPGAAGAGAALGSGGPAMGQAMLAQRIAAQYQVLRSALDQFQTRAVLTAIRAIAEGVRQIEGRKTLILFSQGFVVGEAIEPQLHATTEMANRAHLAIYCIDARGLEATPLANTLIPTDEFTASSRVGQRDRTKGAGGETIFDATLQAGHDMNEGALRYVAYATGGFYVHNTNDLATGLTRLDEETRSYYLLVYRPKNQTLDGKFRQIRVEVRNPDLTVRARNGYYAIPAGFDLLSPDEFQVVAQARSASARQQMPLYARAGSFRDKDGQYRVPVVLEIPTQSIQFEEKGQANYARFQIVGMVRDPANNLVARFGGPARFHLSEGEYQMAATGSISFVDWVRLPAGKAYVFEVAVKDMASEKVADREVALYLREPSANLAMSTILLAKEVEKAEGGQNQFLSVGGTKILPSARCEFHNGDNLIFYFDIYHPKLETDQEKTDVSVDLALLRDGQRVNVRLPSYRLNQNVYQPLPHITFARYIQLAGLQAGNYTLVVRVKDALAHQEQNAQAAFSVIN